MNTISMKDKLINDKLINGFGEKKLESILDLDVSKYEIMWSVGLLLGSYLAMGALLSYKLVEFIIKSYL